MRRLALLALTLAGTLVAPFAAACGGDDEGGDSGKLSVIATIAPVGALVTAVAGADADVRVLVPAGVDPHDYELKASDRRAVERAKVLFRNGLGIDGFLDSAIADSDGTVVTVTDGLALRAADGSAHAAGDTHDHEGEDHPHAWHDIDAGSWPPGYPADKRQAYSLAEIRRWLKVFAQRFYSFSQFKRSALPNGPKVSHGGSLSPRGDWRAPSDMSARIWLDEIEREIPEQ